MNFQNIIENKFFSKKAPEPFEAYADCLFVFAKDFGWTPEEADRVPIPIALALLERSKRYYEQQAKSVHKK